MNKLKISLLTATLLCSSINAYEFQPIGFESISMGGAGVANAKGSMAGYYNPALLGATSTDTEVNLGFGIGLSENNLANNIDRLSTLEMSDTIEGLETNSTNNAPIAQSTINTIKEISTIVNSMSEEEGSLRFMPSATISAQIKNFGFGIYTVGDISASIKLEKQDSNGVDVTSAQYSNIVVKNPNDNKYYEIDTTNNKYTETIESVYNKSFISAIQEDETSNREKASINVEALLITEVPISYSYGFNNNNLNIGASIKYMNGIHYKYTEKLDTESGDIDDNKDDAQEITTGTFGVDVGILYTPEMISGLSIGGVVKNINSPKFDTDSTEKITIDPMARVGIAYRLLDSIDLAIDADITENDMIGSERKSQYIGGGININPLSWVSLRAGAMNNIAQSEDGLIYTAGISFGAKWIQLDLSAQLSTDETTIDGDSIPKYSRVNFALVSKW